MKKLLALLLILAMVFSMMTFLAACDSEDTDDDDDKSDKDDKDEDDKKDNEDEDEEDEEEGEIYGEWKGTMNFAAEVNRLLEDMTDSDTLEYLELKEFDLDVIMEFTEDGELTMGFDKGSFEDSLADHMDDLVDGLVEYAEDNGFSQEELEDGLEMTLEEFLETGLTEGFDAYYGEEVSLGYELDGNELTIENEDAVYTVKITTKTLKFVDCSEEDDESYEMLKDISFKRQ